MLSELTSLLMRIAVLFFIATATTEIYTLSLHDALPISFLRHQPDAEPRPTVRRQYRNLVAGEADLSGMQRGVPHDRDRKSTRLNSSHRCISYAVFCLKKKMKPCVRDNRERPY